MIITAIEWLFRVMIMPAIGATFVCGFIALTWWLLGHELLPTWATVWSVLFGSYVGRELFA